MAYTNRSNKDLQYENLISAVMPIYNDAVADTTNGAELFYSPKSMIPPGSSPGWASSQSTIEIEIEGIKKDDFRFYKYK